MKQVIQIFSKPGPTNQISSSQLKKSKKIILVQDSNGLKWKLDYRFRQVSSYLQNMQEQEGQQQDSIIIARISNYLAITNQILELITTFYQEHNFDNQSIKIAKISTEGYEKAIDAISCQFLQKKLKQQNEQSIKNLLNVCQFLKLNGLKQLICVYLASKNFFNFNDSIMKRHLEKNQAFFSRQQEINLKTRMKKYAEYLSLQILQKLREKHEGEYNK